MPRTRSEQAPPDHEHARAGIAERALCVVHSAFSRMSLGRYPCVKGMQSVLIASMKSVLGFFAAVFFTLGAFAQGTVNFANTSTTLLLTNSTVFPWPGQQPNQSGLTTGFSQYTIGLYIAPQGTTDLNAFTLIGPTTLNQSGIASGRFNGNPSGSSFVIPGNSGQPISFQVRAWSTAFGGTFQDAISTCCGAYVGISSVGYVTPGAVGVNLFGTGLGQIGGFVLCPPSLSLGLPCPMPVPEPSSVLLALIGVSAAFGLWCFRRS